jgi:Deoxyribonuclease NucA/NucB
MLRRAGLLAGVCALAMTGGPATASADANPLLRGAWWVQAEACQRQYHSVYVELSRSSYPETTDHISDAIAAGHAALLHIDRENADLHRDQSLENFPPRSGYDRDEYPPAMSEEGGYGASVRYIDPSDNRGAGSVMGNQLEPWCEEQPFRIRLVG